MTYTDYTQDDYARFVLILDQIATGIHPLTTEQQAFYQRIWTATRYELMKRILPSIPPTRNISADTSYTNGDRQIGERYSG